MKSMDLHDIRQDYARQSLTLKECADNPLQQFESWLEQALHAKVNEPTAMNIATVDAQGRPSARMVLLKEVNEQGLVFFSNYQSRKGRSLATHAVAAITFFWPELERQVRFVGRVEKLNADASDAYFASRPYASRLGAWASHQSEVLAAKSQLMKDAALLAARYPLHVPRPPFWGGYCVIPDEAEFWQGRPSRLHDRIHYRQEAGKWLKERLYP